MRYLGGLVGLIAACGGSGDGDGVALDDFGLALAEVYCANLQRCCPAAEVDQWVGPDCVASYAAVFEEEADLVDIRAAVAAGRTAFDAAQAARCLEHVRGLTCTGMSAFMAEHQAGTGIECLKMIRGLVPLDGACGEIYHCASGSCPLDVCTPAIAAGQPCGSDCEDRFECRRCEGTLLCDQGSMTCVQEPTILPGRYCTGA